MRGAAVQGKAEVMAKWDTESALTWADSLEVKEAVVSEDFVGEVMGDLNSRRAQIEGLEARGSLQAVRAHAPLAEMFGYATALRSLTQGRGTFTMEFDYYAEVPKP